MKYFKYIYIAILISVSTMSCEDKFEIITFTEAEMVEIIKLNFVSELGGIEKERELHYTHFFGKEDDCETERSLNIYSFDENYSQDLNWDFYKGCQLDGRIKLVASSNTNSTTSTGTATNNNFSITYSTTGSHTIGEIPKGKFNHFCTCLRQFEITKGVRETQDYNYNIKFLSNAEHFDHLTGKMTEKNIYFVELYISNKRHINNQIDNVEIIGEIFLHDNLWNLKLSNSNTYVF